MGQVSLPRLEKLNVSMGWEGGLLLPHHKWLNPKVYLLSYYLSFSLFFFKKPHFLLNITSSKNKLSNINILKKLKEESFNKKYVLKSYTYQQFNKFKGLVITTKNTQDIYFSNKYKLWYIKEQTVTYSILF